MVSSLRSAAWNDAERKPAVTAAAVGFVLCESGAVEAVMIMPGVLLGRRWCCESSMRPRG